MHGQVNLDRRRTAKQARESKEVNRIAAWSALVLALRSLGFLPWLLSMMDYKL